MLLKFLMMEVILNHLLKKISLQLFLVVHPQNLLEGHIPINHLVGKLYGQLLLLELFHIVDHPQAVQNHLYLLHVLL